MTPEELSRFTGQLHGCLVLSEARGAAASAIGCVELRLGHEQPLQNLAAPAVKLAVAGSGRAKKEDVQRAVAALLGLVSKPLKADEADALALAITAALTWRQA